MTLPLASLIVPSYRGADRLPRLFDALADQTLNTPEFEVIVVVDGLVDDSPALMAAEDRFTVRTVQFPVNRGRVAALNAGFAAADGEILIRCDDDLMPGTEYVRSHIDAHQARENGVIGLTRNVYSPTRFAEVYGCRADERHREAAAMAPTSSVWRHWAGNCSLPRSIWEAVGRYDSSYRLYGWEDVDYGYRIHRAGYPLEIRPELETHHCAAADTTESRVLRASQSAAARRIFEAKFGTDVLPAQQGASSLWNVLVTASAQIVGKSPARAGRVVDRLISDLPIPLAEKLVALTVESAAVAGYRRPHTAKETF